MTTNNLRRVPYETGSQVEIFQADYIYNDKIQGVSKKTVT